MNYLTEIKLFYDWLETHELTPSAILLWHGLMFIANRAGWEQPLTVPMNAIEARTMMTRSSIYRARKVLEESGILATSSRGSHRASIYLLNSFEDGSVLRSASQYETHSETHSGTHSGTQEASVSHGVFQYGTQSGSINKPKLNMDVKEKKKRGRSKTVFSLEEWVSTVESPWRELMRIWLEYKKARKEAYSSEMGAKACLTKLMNLSGNNPQTAQAIIENSMANNWAGLFPLAGQSSRGHPPAAAPATGQRLGQILQPDSEQHKEAVLERFRKGIKTGKDDIPKQ